MYVKLGGNVRTKDIKIAEKIEDIQEKVKELEDYCYDCCESCRYFDKELIGDSWLKMDMSICTHEYNHWVHHGDQICCESIYQMLNNYVPTQEFLKQKIKLKRWIKQFEKM